MRVKPRALKKKINWTPILIRAFRGDRTMLEFSKLLGVPSSTVKRWEAKIATPGTINIRRLNTLSKRERFFLDWKLVGSGRLLVDLEASERIGRVAMRDYARSPDQYSLTH